MRRQRAGDRRRLAAAAPTLGAPLICFPIALDDSALLPTVALSELPRALALLFATNAEVELHMEALRRAALACGGDRHRDGPDADAGANAAASDATSDTTPWQQLLSGLDSAVIEAELAPATEPERAARLARAWFDLGYARDVGATMGLCRARGRRCFERAVALAPHHPAIHFGAAMANFQSARMERSTERVAADGVWRKQFAIALVAPTPQLLRNPTAAPLHVGDRIVCDPGGSARVRVGDVGSLRLAEATRLRVAAGHGDATREGAFHLELERGTVSATIFAAPRVFALGTPCGIAVDLGCIYDTTVDEDGRTFLSVVSGKVSFESDGRKVHVPSGAGCRAWPGFGPGTPTWSDSPEEIRAAVERHDAARAAHDPAAAEAALADLLALPFFASACADAPPIAAAVASARGPGAGRARARLRAAGRHCAAASRGAARRVLGARPRRPRGVARRA
ncbi:MAG: hypothetical protein EXS13_09205 [Planctomycetes bacterium]|nr:hypothetical protein [Planctomycetota bacterium]